MFWMVVREGGRGTSPCNCRWDAHIVVWIWKDSWTAAAPRCLQRWTLSTGHNVTRCVRGGSAWILGPLGGHCGDHCSTSAKWPSKMNRADESSTINGFMLFWMGYCKSVGFRGRSRWVNNGVIHSIRVHIQRSSQTFLSNMTEHDRTWPNTAHPYALPLILLSP